MPNPYHYRAHIDRLWRAANSDIPAYKQLKALKALVREMFPPNPNAARNNRLYHATDPYDVARHLLRDLHDRADSLRLPLPLGEACPVLDTGGWGEGSPAQLKVAPAQAGAAPAQAGAPPTEDEPPEEDDDPL